jgi:hypothetical protein
MVTNAESGFTPVKPKARKSKQSSPVRLSEAFYRRVSATAALNERSIPKHLEYMVNIAESVKTVLSREELLNVQAGLSKIIVEKTEAPRVEKKALFASLEGMRQSGELSHAVTSAEIKYQPSPGRSGYLERLNADGSRDVGMFKGGKFKLAHGSA